MLAAVDNAVTLLHEGSDAFEFKAFVGELANEAGILNKDELKDLGVVNVTLTPKEDSVEEWNEAISKQTDKKTHFYLHVEADTAATVKYQGKNNDDPQRYGHGEGEWFCCVSFPKTSTV